MTANQNSSFSEIEPDGRGFMSGRPSVSFNDFFRDTDVKTDKIINFHSFRHGKADALRRAGYFDEEFNMLLGHRKATTTGPAATAACLRASWISARREAVEYPAVD